MNHALKIQKFILKIVNNFFKILEEDKNLEYFSKPINKMEGDDDNTSNNQKQFVINMLQGFSGTIGFIFIFANIIYQLK